LVVGGGGGGGSLSFLLIHESKCLSIVVRLVNVRLHKKQYKHDFFSASHLR